MKSQPFSRAAAMMSMIAAAMQMPIAMQQSALANIGPYQSRGKGRNSSPFGRKGGHMAAVRASRKARAVKLSRR